MKNNYYYKSNYEKVINRGYSDFVYFNEALSIISLLKKSHMEYNIYKPFPSADKIIVCHNEPKIVLLEIKSKTKLKHNEILGSLFALNIDSNKYSDIMIKDNHYYLIVFDSLKDFLIDNLKLVGKNKVTIELSNIDNISNFDYEYEEIELLVSSERIDNIVSSLTNLSRNNTSELFKNDLVLVNYSTNYKLTYHVKENDIISIRKYGKYKYIGIKKVTKSNRLIINILKYK